MLITRLTVWGMLLGVVYILRSFFLLIFLTFIFAYIQSTAVDRIAPAIRNRSLRAVLVWLILLLLVIGTLNFIVPSVGEQARVFASNYPLYARTVDTQLAKLADRYPLLESYLPERSTNQTHATWAPESSITALTLQRLFGYGDQNEGVENLTHMLETVRGVGSSIVAAVSAFLLSLLFSFLIVLDLPRLTGELKELEHTKVGWVYREVTPSIVSFCRVLGQALEAQFFIALANTILTAIGVTLLGITGKTALLAMIVFLCSFIPIAGVFISSVPICLIALQISGFGLMFAVIGLITVIHLIECYVLNPKIFGHHLHLNAVLVLAVLTVAGKLFGVWGLVLGLPVCTYLFHTAIRYGRAQRSLAEQ